MSTLKVGAIRGVSASSDAITVANDGTCTANITNNLSNRNMIINGAMQVAQRGNKTGATDHYGGCDRFKFLRDGATAVTLSQDTGIPEQGFPKAQRVDVTTADTSMGGTNYNILTTRMEGRNLQRIKKGTANALPITISFYIKSTVQGTYILELLDNDNSRSCSKAYTITGSNNWERKVITFPADTTGAFDNDNNLSMEINWWLGAGPTFTSGTLQDTWGTQVNANRAVGVVNAVNSTSNDIYLTGVQMEVGSIATDFEHRTASDDIMACQRYFQKSSGGSDVFLFAGKGQGSSSCDVGIPLCTPMRGTPTMVCSINRFFSTSTGSFSTSSTNPSVVQYQQGVDSFMLAMNCSGHTSSNNAVGNWSPSSSAFEIDAEL